MAKRARVVVAGATNTDLVAVVDRAPEAGETVTGQSFAVFGGGKGANQAVAASRSGAAVAFVGATGDDAFGSDRREELRADGIDLEGVATITGMASGVALITVERAGENRIAYVPGPTLSISGEQIVEAIDRWRPTVYLQPNEAPPQASRAGLERARALGATTLLNAAPDPDAVRAFLPLVDALIVNEVEAFALLGRAMAFEEAARALSVDGGCAVVLTAGAEGAYAARDGQVEHVPAPRVDVVDTTGAGDTFCGALATRLAGGAAFGEAVRWAVHAGSLACTVAGAQPSIPRAGAVEALLAGR